MVEPEMKLDHLSISPGVQLTAAHGKLNGTRHRFQGGTEKVGCLLYEPVLYGHVTYGGESDHVIMPYQVDA